MKYGYGITKILMTVASVALFVSLTGCATKKYVRQQVDPLTGQINELSEMTRKNANDVKDVDSRSQQGIQTATEKADTADKKAEIADHKAESAQAMSTNLKGQVTNIEAKLGNIDNYRMAETITLQFPFNQFKLDEKSIAALDTLANKVKGQNGYVVQIEGYTDTAGDKEYNYNLSQKRAQSVVRFLAEKHSIPLYRMFIVGLGETKPLEPNTSRQGRAANRRVEIQLLENPEILSAKK